MAANNQDRVHTPAFLQNVSLGFQPRDLIADRVAPRIPVTARSNKFRVWGRDGISEREARWFPGTIPVAISVRWSEAQYYAELYKLRAALTDDENRPGNTDADLQLRTRVTQRVTNTLMVNREKRVASLFTTAANYNSSNKLAIAGGSEWDQTAVAATAAPLTQLMAAAAQVATSAMVPVSQLSLIIPEPVYLAAIWQNSAILDRIKYSERGIVTYDLLASLMGIKEVIPAASMSTGSATPVAGSDVVTAYPASYLWGDNVWLGLIGDSNDDVPSFARSFNWTESTGGQARQIREYRDGDEGREVTWIEGKEAIAEQIIFADAGYLITNTLSTM